MEYMLSWRADHIKAVDHCVSAVQTVLKPAADSGGDEAAAKKLAVEAVRPCGSYYLRSSIRASPHENPEVSRYTADLVVTMSEAACSMDDLEKGFYFDRRRAFSGKTAAFLEAQLPKLMQRRTKDAEEKGSDDDEDGAADQQQHQGKRERRLVPLEGVATTPFSRHPAFRHTKDVTVVSFQSASKQLLVDVRLHYSPAKCPSKVSAAASVKKFGFYSNLVLEDVYMHDHLQRLHATSANFPVFGKALRAVKAWAAHMGLLTSTTATAGAVSSTAVVTDEGLSGFTLSMMMLKLVDDGLQLGSISEENLLRAMWVALSRSQFVDADTGLPTLTLMGNHMNILHRFCAMSPAVADDPLVLLSTRKDKFQPRCVLLDGDLRRAADNALKAADGFAGVMSPVLAQSFAMRYDVVCRVTGVASAGAVTCPSGNLRDAPSCIDATRRLRRAVLTALQARLTRCFVAVDDVSGTATIAVSYTSESDARSRLIRGPPIEERASVTAFDEFWGKAKTSSRQFADGGIFRCAADWASGMPHAAEVANATSGVSMTRDVLSWVCKRHCAETASLTVVGGELLDLLSEPDGSGAAWEDLAPYNGPTLRAAGKAVIAAVQKAAERSLSCKVTSVDIIAASDRDTEVFPVLPHFSLLEKAMAPLATHGKSTVDLVAAGLVSTAAAIVPIHCVIAIDDKKKVPDSASAIAVIKGALIAQLAAAMGGEAGACGIQVRTLCTAQALDVIYQGYLFRFYIAHYREVSLLRALGKAREAEGIERRLFVSVQHAAFVVSVINMSPTAAVVIRLVTRWVSAMYLSDFVLPEAIELLVCHVYQTLEDTDMMPRSPVTGFFRTLQLIATFPFHKQALVMPHVDVATATAAKRTAHAANEELGMFIATTYASDSTPYTMNTPRTMIVDRLKQCAAAALNSVESNFAADGASADVLLTGSTFQLDTTTFDAMLPFHPRALQFPWRQIAPSADESQTTPFASTAASPAACRRVWSLSGDDDATAQEIQRRLGAVVERDVAAKAVRSVRGQTREDAMVFYDSFGPSSIGIVLLAEATNATEAAQPTNSGSFVRSEAALLPLMKAVAAAAPRTFQVPQPMERLAPAPLPKQSHGAKRRAKARVAKEDAKIAKGNAKQNGGGEGDAAEATKPSTEGAAGKKVANAKRQRQEPDASAKKADASVTKPEASAKKPERKADAASSPPKGGKPTPAGKPTPGKQQAQKKEVAATPASAKKAQGASAGKKKAGKA
jgi:hypothetical protein